MNTEFGTERVPQPSEALVLRILRRLFRRPNRNDVWILIQIVILSMGIALAALVAMLLMMRSANATPLTAGDRVQVLIDSGDGFAGKYQLDTQGQLLLPSIDPVNVAGLEPQAAASALSAQLEKQGIFRPGAARTTVQVLWWAPLDVRVSGEVFLPGRIRVNMPASRDKTVERAEEIPGAYTPNRSLSDALKAAGGVTPWSDLARVGIRRGQQVRHVDVRHLMEGTAGEDPALQEGDEIVVTRMAAANPAQARPSGITPPGIKIYVGNLVQNQNNATAANGIGTLTLAYGSRLLQAAIAANCVGGVRWASDRTIALARTDRLSGRARTWEVQANDLLCRADDDINPQLQEGDALGCFDSTATGVREIFRGLLEVLMPMSILRVL